MSSVPGKQPEQRFDLAGPYGRQGISFNAKRFYFRKDAISGTSNNDFWVAPAGTFISFAMIRAVTELDGTPVVTLGTDGDPDALIDSTGFDATTAGNYGSSLGSTTAANQFGLYLPSGDTIRLAITGTPTQGEVSGFVEYYELDAMETQGIHFDIA